MDLETLRRELEPGELDAERMLEGVQRKRVRRRWRRLLTASAGLLAVLTAFLMLRPDSLELRGFEQVAMLPGSGGTLEGPEGFRLTLPDQGVSTPVTVRWSTVNTPEELAGVPGRLATVVDGNPHPLQSFGMVHVQLWVEDVVHSLVGIARIEVPMQSGHPFEEGDAVGLFHLDEDEGMWTEEGNGTVRNGRFAAEVTHFSWWNADEPIALTGCLCGEVRGGEAVVMATGRDLLVRAKTRTHAGRFCVDSLAGARMRVLAHTTDGACLAATAEATVGAAGGQTCGESTLELGDCGEVQPVYDAPKPVDRVSIYVMDELEEGSVRCGAEHQSFGLEWNKGAFAVPVGRDCTVELRGKDVHSFRPREGQHRLFCDRDHCSSRPLAAVRPTSRPSNAAVRPAAPRPEPRAVPMPEPAFALGREVGGALMRRGVLADCRRHVTSGRRRLVLQATVSTTGQVISARPAEDSAAGRCVAAGALTLEVRPPGRQRSGSFAVAWSSQSIESVASPDVVPDEGPEPAVLFSRELALAVRPLDSMDACHDIADGLGGTPVVAFEADVDSTGVVRAARPREGTEHPALASCVSSGSVGVTVPSIRRAVTVWGRLGFGTKSNRGAALPVPTGPPSPRPLASPRFVHATEFDLKLAPLMAKATTPCWQFVDDPSTSVTVQIDVTASGQVVATVPTVDSTLGRCVAERTLGLWANPPGTEIRTKIRVLFPSRDGRDAAVQPNEDRESHSIPLLDVVLRNNDNIKKCFYTAWKAGVELSGRVEFEFIFESDGDLQRATARLPALHGTAFEQCVAVSVPRIRGMRERTVSYSFHVDLPPSESTEWTRSAVVPGPYPATPKPAPEPAPVPAPDPVEVARIDEAPAIHACLRRHATKIPNAGVQVKVTADVTGALQEVTVLERVPRPLETCIIAAVRSHAAESGLPLPRDRVHRLERPKR